MQTLDQSIAMNQFEELVKKCSDPFLAEVKAGLDTLTCLKKAFGICGGHYSRLAESLKACGGEFYVKCPGFDDIARICEFEPAFEAARWKEQIQLDRIARLEAKVQELELKLKR